jgi:hypothetical protein
LRCELAGNAQPDDVRDVLRAGPQPSFVAGPQHERTQWRSTPEIQRTDAFRRVELVTAIDSRSTPRSRT